MMQRKPMNMQKVVIYYTSNLPLFGIKNNVISQDKQLLQPDIIWNFEIVIDI